MQDKILSYADVESITGVSRVTLWRWENDGRFPPRIKIGPNRVGWRNSEIESWVSSRPTVKNPQTSEER